MADLRHLLNPVSENKHIISMPATPNTTPTMTEMPSPRKRTKLTKDAPIFTAGPIRGQCRFPPDEFQDEELAAHHQQFEVTPFGEIADFPRHIPYNSEKKSFLEKTGREHLEVRTTPLFKCTGHMKTAPAKMLNRNPGLRDICHSITGGALVAQGYWIPHAAAKAIAATFCYSIRYALTPVFGHDFPDSCIGPGANGFGDMIIDPSITRHCTEQAKTFREQEKHAISQCSDKVIHPPTPITPTPRRARHTQARKNKEVKLEFTTIYNSPYNSPYNSDTGSDDTYASAASTPEPGYRIAFTPVNTPRQPPRSVPHPERRLPSPRDILSQSNAHHYGMHQEPITPASTLARYSSPEVSPKTIPRKLPNEDITESRGHWEHTNGVQSAAYGMNWLDTHIPEEQQRAAYALLSLKFASSGSRMAQGLGITLPCLEEGRAWSA
ncbi:hypothetical protein LTR64_007745 [Lithohypha guttulata]|uniref:uncharacterized protein n=1 Tax=Lithohypha guttulata TaxID=1690604 RepID=UPI002DE1DC1D|nr:hypothetical protein LTR51_007255 [Lithohypha guttulata]